MSLAIRIADEFVNAVNFLTVGQFASKLTHRLMSPCLDQGIPFTNTLGDPTARTMLLQSSMSASPTLVAAGIRSSPFRYGTRPVSFTIISWSRETHWSRSAIMAATC